MAVFGPPFLRVLLAIMYTEGTGTRGKRLVFDNLCVQQHLVNLLILKDTSCFCCKSDRAAGCEMELSRMQVNVTQLAELVGMNRNLVARRLRELELVGGNGENLKLYELGAALQAILTPSMKENGEMSPQDRKAWYQSENERLKFEEAARDLIPADEVVREYSFLAKAVVMVLETLPDILERDCALTPTAVSRVQSIIDDLRDEMAQKIAENDSNETWKMTNVG